VEGFSDASEWLRSWCARRGARRNAAGGVDGSGIVHDAVFVSDSIIIMDDDAAHAGRRRRHDRPRPAGCETPAVNRGAERETPTGAMIVVQSPADWVRIGLGMETDWSAPQRGVRLPRRKWHERLPAHYVQKPPLSRIGAPVRDVAVPRFLSPK
jgi:hypothetical protein